MAYGWIWISAMMLHFVVILTQTETKENHGFKIVLKHSNFATIIQGSFQGCWFDVGLFLPLLCPVALL